MSASSFTPTDGLDDHEVQQPVLRVGPPPDEPVVMLNLLRFADGGRESDDQYAKALSETFLPRYGGEVLYAGDGSTPLGAE